MIETRLLYYFLAVAREQNITKAAEYLHISQPSLSKQMYELEDTLGKKLLIRGNKQTTLTEDGAFFRSKAEEIISLLEKTESSFNISNTISGDISFGAAETKNIEVFTKIFKDISNLYPKVKFNIHSGDAYELFERLDKGLIDLALMIDPEFFDKYNYYKLPLKETFGLLVRKDDELSNLKSISNDDIKGLPLIISRQEHRYNKLITWTGSNENLNIVSTYNLIFNATYFVLNRMGYAFTLEGLVNNDELIFIPFEPSISASLYIVTKKYQNHSEAMKLVLNEIYKIK